MQRPTIKTLILATTAAAFALGAANAYAADAESRIWIHDKTAVSENPPVLSATVIRVDEDLPEMVAPLNTDMRMGTVEDAPRLQDERAFTRETDLRNIDLVDDSAIFIGGQGPSEFDTRDARFDSGSYPEYMGVEPLFPVAGAGVSTSF
ncbi:MAG: hypothetical protein WBF53_16380 [Litorimonas sp.]